MDKDATDLSINPDIYSALKQATPTRLDVLRDILAQLSIDSSCGTLPKPSHCVLWSNSDVILHSIWKIFFKVSILRA